MSNSQLKRQQSGFDRFLLCSEQNYQDEIMCFSSEESNLPGSIKSECESDAITNASSDWDRFDKYTARQNCNMMCGLSLDEEMKSDSWICHGESFGIMLCERQLPGSSIAFAGSRKYILCHFIDQIWLSDRCDDNPWLICEVLDSFRQEGIHHITEMRKACYEKRFTDVIFHAVGNDRFNQKDTVCRNFIDCLISIFVPGFFKWVCGQRRSMGDPTICKRYDRFGEIRIK